MTKIYTISAGIALLIFIILLIEVNILKTELEQTNLILDKKKTELALARQSLTMAELNIATQNESMLKSQLDLEQAKIELSAKVKSLDDKYTKSRAEAAEGIRKDQSCDNKLAIIGSNQSSFFMEDNYAK